MSDYLGIPAVGTNARSNIGLKELMDAVYDMTEKTTLTHYIKFKYDCLIEEAIEIVRPSLEKIFVNSSNCHNSSINLDNALAKKNQLVLIIIGLSLDLIVGGFH